MHPNTAELVRLLLDLSAEIRDLVLGSPKDEVYPQIRAILSQMESLL